MAGRQIENFNEIFVRCFPRSFDQFMVNWYVDEFRRLVGPVRYFRLVQDHNNNRLDTVGYLCFYSPNDNLRCLTTNYPIFTNPQETSHLLQFRPNFTTRVHNFHDFPNTEIVIIKYLRGGDRSMRTWVHGGVDPDVNNRHQDDDRPQPEGPQVIDERPPTPTIEQPMIPNLQPRRREPEPTPKKTS